MGKPMTKRRYGQVGVGSLGHHFALRLRETFGALTIHDIDADRIASLEGPGIEVAASAKALAAESDVMILSLPNPGAVETVMCEDDGVLAGAAANSLVIDTSSIDPDTSRRMHAAAMEREVRYLEAPLTSAHPGSAGVAAARDGSFTVLVGGEAADLEDARAVLEVFAHRVIHLGAVGSGSVMKLISNQISGISYIAIAEGLALAAAAGFSAETTLDVLSETVARSYALDDDLAPRVRARDYSPTFTTDLMYKDHRLAAELARSLKVPMPLNALAVETYQILRAKGRGGLSCIDVVNLVAEMSGVDIHDPSPQPSPASGREGQGT